MTSQANTMQPGENIGLAIVDDHELLAQALGLAFAREGITPNIIAPSTEEHILESLTEQRPAIVLLDLMLGPIGSSLPLIEPILALGAAVLIMTGEQDPIFWAECFEAGAADVLSKSIAFEDLIERVTAIAAGNFSNAIQRRSELLTLLREHRRAQTVRMEAFDRLTTRESEVLGLLIAGHSPEVISNETFVAVATVRSHIRSILTKLGVNSQLAAVAKANSAGWNNPNIGLEDQTRAP
jgi:two-component system, NarL family, nitrate/nitrite response regulator NarL